MTEAEQLQDHLARLRSRWPVRLTDEEATVQALRLRACGMTYRAVAVAMAEYHGYWLSGAAWQRRCRLRGAVVRKGPNAVRAAR
jgi:hypothetical protein